MLHAVASAVKGVIERAMPMNGSIDEEGESRNLMRSFLRNGTGHRFLGIKSLLNTFRTHGRFLAEFDIS